MTGRIRFGALDAVTALPRAKLGDLDGLAERLRSGAELSQEERDFIADYLIGAVRPNKAAFRREQKIADHLAIATWVLRQQIVNGGPLEAAIVEAEAATGYKRRTIQATLKKHLTLPGFETREALLDALRSHVARRRK
ncbi:hypothetical protein [Brevundimonas sp.]|uniref:hypothetical protein n=1 Tax=Brevundimonas sp. TaxID=1871086 RepID=UPI002D571994|nr:hypothetical protein [Brevundimonas sp.]HYC98533.1 hypothetical protein [Brevundimonas sp.]